MLGKNLAEHRKVAVMSQGQFAERIYGEPRDGIVLVRRDVDRRPAPRFDQPDLHVERGATNGAREIGDIAAPGRRPAARP